MASMASLSEVVVFPSTVKTGDASGLSIRHSWAISVQLVCLEKASLIASHRFLLLSFRISFLISAVILNLCLPSGPLGSLFLSPISSLIAGSWRGFFLGVAFGMFLATSENISSNLAMVLGGLALMAASARFPKSLGLASSLFLGVVHLFVDPYVGDMWEREPYRPVVALHVPA